MAEPFDNLEALDTMYGDPLDELLLDDQFINDDCYGAVIDMDDNEQPITEKMILDACAELEKDIDSIYDADFTDK